MKQTYISGIISTLLLLSLSGCWKENVSNCWMGDVTVRVVAEKFQSSPGGDLEENLGRRVKTLRYYLYKEEALYRQGVIDSRSALDVQHLILSFPKLGFGNYSLALLANVPEGAIEGTDVCEHLSFDYPGISDTDDYLVSCYKFTVDCDCGLDDFAVLHRTQGVIELQLKNLPDNITEIEIELDKLSNMCSVDTLYHGETSSRYRIATEQVKKGNTVTVVTGSFPTVTDGQTALILKLYADGQPGFLAFKTKITDLRITRNQLIRMAADFKNDISGKIEFSIKVNPSWDGTEGGELPVE